MALAALAVSAAAQTRPALNTQPPAGESLTIRRLVPEVQMMFSAHDRRGQPVHSLCAPQVSVLDNGVAAALTSFQAADGLPLRLALLLDASDSMSAGFTALGQAAAALARRAQGSGCDQIFDMTFAAREASSGQNRPEGGFHAHPLGGQTALYDALIAASARLHSNTPARRVLLLFSDGEDNYSRGTLADALAALQQGNIAVYSITVHSGRLEYPGDRVLRQIAAATGGRAFLLHSWREISGIFPILESNLHGQYVVGFRPPAGVAVGEFRSVKIVALPRGTVIRARSGYYVGPQE